jgi:hypothetical protein
MTPNRHGARRRVVKDYITTLVVPAELIGASQLAASRVIPEGEAILNLKLAAKRPRVVQGHRPRLSSAQCNTEDWK